jgi:O-antigen/teichoic acid export membrane protein
MTISGSNVFLAKLFRNLRWQSIAVLLRALISVIALALIVRESGQALMGLFGVAWVSVALCFSIIQGMSGHSLIGIDDVDSNTINAASFISLLSSLAMCMGLVISAPLWGLVIGNSDLEDAMKLGALFIPFMNLAVVENAIVQRSLDFKLFAKVQTIATVLSALSALFFAFYIDILLGLFSLTGLIGAFQFLIYRCLGRPIPFGLFSWADITKVFRAGKHFVMTATSVVVCINSPQILLTQLLPIEQVGVFVLCRRIIEMISVQISSLVNTVIFPSFTKIRDDTLRMSRSFLGCNYYIALVMMIPLIALAANAPDFLELYAGASWRLGGDVLILLVVMQLALNFGQSVFPTFFALGDYSSAWKWNVLLTLLQVSLLLGFRANTAESASLILAFSALVTPVIGLILSNKLNFSFSEWLLNLSMITALGFVIIVLASLESTRLLIADYNVYTRLFIVTCSSITLYLSTLLFLGLTRKYR